MVYKATRLIEEAFKKEGLKFSVEEEEKRSYITAGFSIKSGPNVRMLFISRDDDNDVSLRLFGVLSSVDESKVPEITKIVNECNCTYRFVKFCIDSDNDVNVECDLPERTPDDGVGPMCAEYFIRTMKILDEVYPKFMKALWA